MGVFIADSNQFQQFTEGVDTMIQRLSAQAKAEDIAALQKLIANFKIKTEDFYRENRKLNIGVVGQVKAGKSSFLNTLLFDGQEILPKAATPKTATLTKMEYSEQNSIHIEYYAPEEWAVLADNAAVDSDDEVYASAREIVGMVRKNGIDPVPYLEKGTDDVAFATYDELAANLNNYVGEDGKFTPIIKAVTLYLNKEEFHGLSIVDTPGLNDPIASRTIRTKEFMEVCDVVFFLSQSGSFLDKSDWTLLSSQLPQKGVKRLVLIASKFDSGIRDVLRVQDADDVFGEDENTASTIPAASKIIRKKLRKRAKAKVEEFVCDLEYRGSSAELMEVIRQCTTPIMVSALAHNMTNKPASEYSIEEKNVYAALHKFSPDMDSDLRLLGNFDEVKDIFAGVVSEKEGILEEKAKSFIPTAQAELAQTLEAFQKRATKRVSILEGNDRDQLMEQRKLMEGQINSVRADIAGVFGELGAKLESERARGVRELRGAGKDYLEVKERTGTTTRTNSYTTGYLFWKKTHYSTYEEHYSYCIAADAVENLRKYSLEAVNQVEEVFTDALELREIKRKLLNVIVNNFDMGSEKYDSSLFRIIVEETVSAIEFPLFSIDITDAMSGIAAKFTGELTSAGEKTKLSTALSDAVFHICNELSDKLVATVKAFKESMSQISKTVEVNLLADIKSEFETLLAQCENKEKEIGDYKTYISELSLEMKKL